MSINDDEVGPPWGDTLPPVRGEGKLSHLTGYIPENDAFWDNLTELDEHGKRADTRMTKKGTPTSTSGRTRRL